MIKKSTSVAVAVLLAASLSGCAPKALEVIPGPSVAPVGTPAVVSVAEPEKDALAATAALNPSWGEVVKSEFLDSYDRTEFSQFSDGTPHQQIKTWDTAPNGNLLVTIGNTSRAAADLRFSQAQARWLALEIMSRGREVEQMKSVTVTTQDGKISRTVNIGDH